MIYIKQLSAISNKTGKSYDYVSIVTDTDIELVRLFPKQTEKDFYKTMIGGYEKVED